ncbi:hypothetical protein HHI36_004400 [Cryptolaemus montrouzieri]|uniref:Large ribosomal subunit protein uL10m n=1 Tax=Cryptolaemus montrouzieri TaxID=559131 RepID=A0ABD2NRI3_9CUCU
MLLLRKSFLEVGNPLLQTVRFRGKINVQKPKPPHFERAKYLAISKPWFISKNKDKTSVELCRKNVSRQKEGIENPLQRIIAQETLTFFQSSKLIGFYHANPMKASEQFKAFAMFKKEGMLLKGYGRKTMEMAVKGTHYEAILDIWIPHTMVVFSPEPKIKELLRITRRFHQLVLIAGVYEGHFMNVEDLTKYSTILNLETAQAMLVHTLNASASKLHRQLNSHQTSLLALLEDRKKQLSD